MLAEFDSIYRHRLDYARTWKEHTGRKVLGYLCTYIPEEIVYAAGVLPIRILGSHEVSSITDEHVHSAMFCPFCRDVLAQGLLGRYDFLDGLAIAQSCIHMRQAFFSWQIHRPPAFTYFLPHPMHVQSPRAIPYLKNELVRFKDALQAWTGNMITDDDLRCGIEILNRNRRLLERLYTLRQRAVSPVTGAEAMKTVVASQLSDKQEHSKALEHLLPEIACQQPARHNGVRLLMFGSDIDDFPFIEMVESLGATIVIEDHCTGSRYFWGEVDETLAESDPLQAIAERYVKRVPCPSKDWPERSRGPHLLRLARDWKADGAIIIQQQFCDPHEMDIPALRALLEGNGVPCYFVQLGVTIPLERERAPIAAFIEGLRKKS